MTTTQTQIDRTTDSSTALVDPRAPRFGQSITATLLLLGVGLGEPMLIGAVAVILGVSVLSGWRFDLYRFLWQRLAIPVVGRPEHREPAAPHRFAKLLGAAGSGLAILLLLAGVPTLGFAVAALVGVAAGLAAVTGICLGCRMYRQVSFLRARDIV